VKILKISFLKKEIFSDKEDKNKNEIVTKINNNSAIKGPAIKPNGINAIAYMENFLIIDILF